MVREVEDPFGREILFTPASCPHVPDDPGAVRWPGPPVGAHTDEVCASCSARPAEIARLRQEGDLMEKSNGQAVEIVEVGPRDGFQPIGPFIPTETKVRFLERLVAAGVRRVEIGSFVSAKAVPQLRDTAEVRPPRGYVAVAQVLVPSERAATRRWRRVPSIWCSWCR